MWEKLNTAPIQERPPNQWFYFRQNNSGGSYDGAEHIFIRAYDASQANNYMETLGNYFDEGCPTCGDRWIRQDNYEAISDQEVIETIFTNTNWYNGKPINGEMYDLIEGKKITIENYRIMITEKLNEASFWEKP